MNAKDVIKNSIDMGHEILTAYLGDLADDDLMLRPVPGMNHIAWQLGHLISAEHQMISDAGFAMPPLPDGFAESYAKETSTSDDPSKFAKKQQYLDWLEQQRAGTMAALNTVSDTDLDKATPESMQAYAPTVGSAFNVIGIHTMMHAAQFVAVRRKLERPVLI